MTDTPTFLSLAELQAGLDHIRRSPQELGRLELIVRRPADNARETLPEARLDPSCGLEGDNWLTRTSKRHPERPPDPNTQINLMNARVIGLIAPDASRWPLAGDQLFVDLDLSGENLPVGTRLAIGSAVLEITAVPHTGCSKFAARFGVDAMRFVNAEETRSLHLRGVNACVVQPGAIRQGDEVRKLRG